MDCTSTSDSQFSAFQSRIQRRLRVGDLSVEKEPASVVAFALGGLTSRVLEDTLKALEGNVRGQSLHPLYQALIG